MGANNKYHYLKLKWENVKALKHLLTNFPCRTLYYIQVILFQRS